MCIRDRVDCDYKTSRFKYIKKNFKQQLSPYFNLDSINWQLVHSYAITNLEKKAIKQYNSGDSEEMCIRDRTSCSSKAFNNNGRFFNFMIAE